MTDAGFNFPAIGRVHACYKEKFGVPRQPGLVKVHGSLELFAEYSRPEAVRGLEGFSHIWVLFVFHQTQSQGWQPTVRPPRLGGNARVGVFASRSMFRPNPIGLSVVELTGIRHESGRILLDIRGGDFIDGTPILDIKPYLPYVDAVEDASGGYANTAPRRSFIVKFTDNVVQTLHSCRDSHPGLEDTLREILQYDPRPSYQSGSGDGKTSFAMRLYDFDVKWRVEADSVTLYELQRL